jgi:hypothetical protein
MCERVTVRSWLTRETVTLHSTRKSHSSSRRARVHKLSNLEEIRLDDAADLGQTLLALDSKFGNMAFDGDLAGGKMASLGAGDVSRLFRSGANLHRPVAVDVAAFVADDLAPLDLKDCAGQAFRGDGVVDSCHAFLDAKRAGTVRESELFPLKGGPL